MHPRLHFRRFEFKYLLAAPQASAVRAYLQRYMQPDPFAAQTAAGRYEVRSVYFDSPQFYYYYEKLDGTKKRKKLRLRTYRAGGRFAPYVFFEIKRKNEAIVYKDRFVMSLDEYGYLSDNNNLPPGSESDDNRRKIMREFLGERAWRSIGPKILVAYEREPFLGRHNRNVRVTFDHNLRALENDNLFYGGREWLPVFPGRVIVEIKFNGLLPFYLQDVIRRFSLQRLAVSKYCYGLERCAALSWRTWPRPTTPQFINLFKQKALWALS